MKLVRGLPDIATTNHVCKLHSLITWQIGIEECNKIGHYYRYLLNHLGIDKSMNSHIYIHVWCMWSVIGLIWQQLYNLTFEWGMYTKRLQHNTLNKVECKTALGFYKCYLVGHREQYRTVDGFILSNLWGTENKRNLLWGVHRKIGENKGVPHGSICNAHLFYRLSVRKHEMLRGGGGDKSQSCMFKIWED